MLIILKNNGKEEKKFLVLLIKCLLKIKLKFIQQTS